ncbi:MAG TPA: hypothetical protein PK228_21500 [Saprospiraceae bacterium]|nr:hypothetical protein [Saprospiraceae bacterium]
MTNAAKSVYYFGFYLLVLGLTLVFVPNILLTMFGFEPATEVWIRVLGAVVFAIGIYYVFTAPTNNETFIKTTIYVRSSILAWFTLFVLLGWAQPALMLFGGIDVLGALWTWNALRTG